MSYEITDSSYFLASDGCYLTKAQKSDLQTLLKNQKISIYEFSFKEESYSVVLIDFMAEARKIEARRKKFNLKTFGDAVTDIWNSCWNHGKSAKRIDIVFDCYVNDTIKGLERQRRGNADHPNAYRKYKPTDTYSIRIREVLDIGIKQSRITAVLYCMASRELYRRKTNLFGWMPCRR